ncbi:hypothetical protein HDR63_01485 [bacterium]|nr:hypothetical protein [bacterium]
MAKFNKQWFNQMLARCDRRTVALWLMVGAVCLMLGVTVRQCSETNRARNERRAETSKKIALESQVRELSRENDDLTKANVDLQESNTALYQKIDSCQNNAPVPAVTEPAAPKANVVRPQENRPALTNKPARPVVKKVATPATQVPVDAPAAGQSANVIFQDNAVNNGTINVNNGTVNNYNGAGVIRVRFKQTRVYEKTR